MTPRHSPTRNSMAHGSVGMRRLEPTTDVAARLPSLAAVTSPTHEAAARVLPSEQIPAPCVSITPTSAAAHALVGAAAWWLPAPSCCPPMTMAAFAPLASARRSPCADADADACHALDAAPDEKYNLVLRGSSDSNFFQSDFQLLCRGNRYVTTLHTINSAVVKLGKLTKATNVYRGVSGGLLPEKFWKANEFNVRGGVDFGFMSTTLDKNVAISYASATAQRIPVLFQMRMGMIDRGAPCASEAVLCLVLPTHSGPPLPCLSPCICICG